GAQPAGLHPAVHRRRDHRRQAAPARRAARHLMTSDASESDQKRSRNMAETKVNPIYLNVGRQTNKRLRRLKRGEGRLTDEVYDAVRDAHPGLDLTSGEVVPVVVLVRRKEGKRRRSVGR